MRTGTTDDGSLDAKVLDFALMTIFDRNEAASDSPTASAEEWTLQDSPWCHQMLQDVRHEYSRRTDIVCRFSDYEIARRYVNGIRKSKKNRAGLRVAAGLA